MGRGNLVLYLNSLYILYMLNTMKVTCILTVLPLMANLLGPIPLAGADDFPLPAPGVMVRLSPEFNAPVLKGIKVHADNPFRFDFILDQGDSSADQEQLKTEAAKLIKYFLTSLTIPEKDLWVNLSPYEKDRIIPHSFGLTEMGRDLLAEDYLLKQITASLIYPEDETGKRFWKRVYEEAAKRFGTTDVPVDTFNKVWIVPEKAVVYENAGAGTAFVVDSKLKVMLEQDYLAFEKNTISSGKDHKTDVNALGSRIVREIVVPELTREVNEDKNFTRMRQVYNSLILAAWFKKKIKDSILSHIYDDRNKVAGVNIDDAAEKERIYGRYLTAFKKGVYSYIKEEQNALTREVVPRKYFSGGVAVFGYLDKAMSTTSDTGQLPEGIDRFREITVNLLPQVPGRRFSDAAMTAQTDWDQVWSNLEKIKAVNEAAVQEHLKALIDHVLSIGNASGINLEEERLKALETNGTFKDGFLDDSGRLIRSNGPTIQDIRKQGRTPSQVAGKNLEEALLAKLDEEAAEAWEDGAKANDLKELKRHLVNLLQAALTLTDIYTGNGGQPQATNPNPGTNAAMTAGKKQVFVVLAATPSVKGAQESSVLGMPALFLGDEEGGKAAIDRIHSVLQRPSKNGFMLNMSHGLWSELLHQDSNLFNPENFDVTRVVRSTGDNDLKTALAVSVARALGADYHVFHVFGSHDSDYGRDLVRIGFTDNRNRASYYLDVILAGNQVLDFGINPNRKISGAFELTKNLMAGIDLVIKKGAEKDIDHFSTTLVEPKHEGASFFERFFGRYGAVVVKDSETNPTTVSVRLDHQFWQNLMGSIKPSQMVTEDMAMSAAGANKGGIDLNLVNMDIQTRADGGIGIKFHLDPAMIKQYQDLSGFVPVIVNIQRMTDLRDFLAGPRF
jgi:hypothetical protein